MKRLPGCSNLFSLLLSALDRIYKSSWPDEWLSPAQCRKELGRLQRLLRHRNNNLMRVEARQAAKMKIVFARTGKRKGKFAGKRTAKVQRSA